jgi:hypothetical protein
MRSEFQMGALQVPVRHRTSAPVATNAAAPPTVTGRPLR